MPVPRCGAVLLLLAATACASATSQPGITRERAIAIAKTQVKWTPFEEAATRAKSNGREIWRVTLKGRLPGQPPLLFETGIVEVGARTGEIVSVAKT